MAGMNQPNDGSNQVERNLLQLNNIDKKFDEYSKRKETIVSHVSKLSKLKYADINKQNQILKDVA